MIQDTLTRLPQIPAAQSWPVQGRWTYNDWLQLPDDGSRYEVIDGVLRMEPPPAVIGHQRPSFRLATLMDAHVRAHRLGEVCVAAAGVRFPGQPVPLQPDIFFIAAGRSDIAIGEYVEGAPDLVVEVLSPGTARYDRTTKLRVYERAGVREYWIVDSRAESIEIYVLVDGRHKLRGMWGLGQHASSELLSGFSVAVDELFG